MDFQYICRSVDPKRPLTPRSRRALPKALWPLAKTLTPELLVVSPLRRAPLGTHGAIQNVIVDWRN